jgi:hypothetical protein
MGHTAGPEDEEPFVSTLRSRAQRGQPGLPRFGNRATRASGHPENSLGVALCVRLLDVCSSRADDPKTSRPKVGDQLVLVGKEDHVIKPEDLPVEGLQQLAYPMDPRDKIVRDESYFNQVALVRLDPTQLSEETRSLAADGVVAYSVVCTHQGVPRRCGRPIRRTCSAPAAVHNSTLGTAPRSPMGRPTRRLPMLPLKSVDGVLVVAAEFTGRVGPTSPLR